MVIPTCRSFFIGVCPLLWLTSSKACRLCSWVGIDDRAAMRELADHVLGLGHREIGLLTMRLDRDRR